jgi:hypothetical protein
MRPISRGNGMDSRMWRSPQIHDTVRSIPRPYAEHLQAMLDGAK